jgi:hypothetical protein
MLERDTTVAELYENWAAHTQRVSRANSEFSKVIAWTLNALTESQELIAGAVLARNGVFVAAQKSPLGKVHNAQHAAAHSVGD